jgi:SagB-type dehydrogenase family enzyme
MTTVLEPRARETRLILPPPQHAGHLSVEAALYERRSIREYATDSLTAEEIAQLLWAAQGITHADGLRTTPSAGAIYPLEIYASVQGADGLPEGLYRYLPGLAEHRVQFIKPGRFGSRLCELSTTQDFIREVPLNIVMAAVSAPMTEKYGDLADRYIAMELGHCAQNIHLQAEALHLGSVAIGFLQGTAVRELFEMIAEPLYMVSVGRKRGR